MQSKSSDVPGQLATVHNENTERHPDVAQIEPGSSALDHPQRSEKVGGEPGKFG
jgi:hypothetical protein